MVLGLGPAALHGTELSIPGGIQANKETSGWQMSLLPSFKMIF